MGAEPYTFPVLESAPAASPPTGPAQQIEEGAQRLAEVEAEARAHGYAAGLEEGRQRVEQACRALQEVVEGLAREREALMASVEQRACELALMIAEKILATSLEVDRELVRSVVAGALRRVVECDRVVVAVNPDDLDVVREAGQDLAGRLGGPSRVEVVADRRVERGGCVVRTAVGEIDARASEQLARAREILAEALGHRLSDG